MLENGSRSITYDVNALIKSITMMTFWRWCRKIWIVQTLLNPIGCPIDVQNFDREKNGNDRCVNQMTRTGTTNTLKLEMN